MLKADRKEIGVIGPQMEADIFAKEYLHEIKGSSIAAECHELFHVLIGYHPPHKPLVHGERIIQANASHFPLLVDWWMRNCEESLTLHPTTREAAEKLIHQRLLIENVMYLLEVKDYDSDHGKKVVSMASASVCDEKMIRISMIFTPPEERYNEHTPNFVNLLSKHFLDYGKTCVVNTDAINQIEHNWLKPIGYRMISEEKIINFKYEV